VILRPVGWSRKFDDPIPLPNGKKLVTLRDAALHIHQVAQANITARAGHKGGLSETPPPTLGRGFGRSYYFWHS
jgi:hypothetical protein